MNWKTQTILIGTVVGAVTGALAGLLLIKRAEQNQQAPNITASDSVKIGMGAMGLVRMISDLGTKKSITHG
jgi:gas vesicle protein